MHNVGEVNLLGHKLRILENFITEYLLFHTIESVVLPVCPGADTPKLDSSDCSIRFLFLGPFSIHKTYVDNTFLSDLLQ